MADTTVSTSGITGSDGKTPIYEPNGRWTIWRLQELYAGGVGANKYVPKINDYVVDTDTNQWYRVTYVDPTTLVSTFVSLVWSQDTSGFSTNDLLLGVGPGTQSDTYRIYIDRSVIPHTLAVDARLRVNGSMVTTCKIFKGSELAGNEQVISAMYDANNNLLGQAIPLELVAVPNDLTNKAIKSVPVCYTTEELQDGELVTAVFYSDTANVVSKRQLLVENTGYIRTSNDAVKYITGIGLESPFLSQADDHLLQYPINVPLDALDLVGVVNYSDGSALRLPVDGTKFQVFGLEGFVSTIVGQQLSFVLKYNLSADEIVYGATVNGDRFKTETYTAKTLTRDGIYSVKLFGFPVWVDAVTGYRLKWYLYNLDRDTVFDATSYVAINVNTRAFDPLAYGVSQTLSVSVNLNKVNPSYKNYIHTQSITFVLAEAGDAHTRAPWTVAFDPGQTPPFGVNNHVAMAFVNQNLRNLTLAMGETDLNAWLARVFYAAEPLVDQQTETQAPVPTHFDIDIGGTLLEFPIAAWNTVIPVSQVLNNSDTLFVRFFKRTPQTDLQLGVAGLPIWQSN